MTALSPNDDTRLAQLYERVTAAILAAEKAEAADNPGATADAYLNVSFLEDEIAKLLPATEPEGEVARRGAITAALSARLYLRAVALAECYLADTAVSLELRTQLMDLKQQATESHFPHELARDGE